MATLAEEASSLVQYYLTDVWIETGDPRLREYPMMGTLKTPLTIFVAYHLLVQHLLPRWMAHRKAFSLKWIIIPYNLVLSLANLYFSIQVIIRTDYGQKLFDVSFRPTDVTSSAEMSHINFGYLYYLSKLVDKLDTVFFVLRKKESQLTGLHLYHHSMVPLMAWVYIRTNALHVSCIAFCFLNSPIHMIMYAYYGLAAFGPQMQPYLCWKRYLTQLQILQFVLLFSHGLYFTLYQTGYSPLWSVVFLLEVALYLALFTRFYLKSYKAKRM